MQDLPHLLHIFLTEGEYDYLIECPYEEDGAERECALLEECNEHPEPLEPEMHYPPYRWTNNVIERDDRGHPLYATDADPEAVKAWSAYDVAMEEWDALHEDATGFHRVNECWVKEWVRIYHLSDEWDLVNFQRVEVSSPIAVHWTNRGTSDDSYLELSPWEENAAEENSGD